MKRAGKRLCSVAILLLMLGLAGCGGKTSASVAQETAVQSETAVAAEEETILETEVVEAEAKNMLLNHFEGELSVTEEGTALAAESVYDGMKLLSGDSLETALQSYAWIGLDAVKELKMDQNSVSVIKKDGNDLVINLEEGNMFFHLAESLSADEQMHIKTTNMDIAIRGTTGIVEKISDYETMVVLLEGELEITQGAWKHLVTLKAGQCAEIVGTGDDYNENIFVRNIYAEDVPAFVEKEVADREDIQQKIVEHGGEVENDPNPFLPAIIQMVEKNKLPDGRKADDDYVWDFSIQDVDGDGADELITEGQSSGIYGYNKENGEVVREDPFPDHASIRGIYEGGTIHISILDDSNDQSIWRYDPETKEYKCLATWNVEYLDKNTGAATGWIECDELDLHGNGHNEDDFDLLSNQYLRKPVDLREMEVVANSVMQLQAITDYRENITVKDGTYSITDGYGLVLGSYEDRAYKKLLGITEGNSFCVKNAFEYTSPEGKKEKLSERVLAFPIDENTVYHLQTWAYTEEEFVDENRGGYSGAGKIKIVVKDGVCTEVTIKD